MNPEEIKQASDTVTNAGDTAAKILADAVTGSQVIVAKATERAAELLEKTNEHTTKSVADALREVFNENVDSSRFIDVTKIPLLCQSVVNISSRLTKIEENLTWGVRLIIGAVILGVIALLIK